jgi:hypothetical protein
MRAAPAGARSRARTPTSALFLREPRGVLKATPGRSEESCSRIGAGASGPADAPAAATAVDRPRARRRPCVEDYRPGDGLRPRALEILGAIVIRVARLARDEDERDLLSMQTIERGTTGRPAHSRDARQARQGRQAAPAIRLEIGQPARNLLGRDGGTAVAPGVRSRVSRDIRRTVAGRFVTSTRAAHAA